MKSRPWKCVILVRRRKHCVLRPRGRLSWISPLVVVGRTRCLLVVGRMITALRRVWGRVPLLPLRKRIGSSSGWTLLLLYGRNCGKWEKWFLLLNRRRVYLVMGGGIVDGTCLHTEITLHGS